MGGKASSIWSRGRGGVVQSLRPNSFKSVVVLLGPGWSLTGTTNSTLSGSPT
ncbi:hypothetical protein CCACVL1_16672 [Corchorus capsularis]|uniref:Uncharacterized protein n=1 Tax=Corchorus capsularis TaxID=210143 RepID=A0A1R3HW73_COCAP|nr:hypothetical protein CCACVL1_16672 [Corchorus capsularis]